MPPPLTTNGQVTYADGTPPTVDQMATDVAAFLVWTAQPNLENRHAAGLAVSIFLLIATILGYLAYQQIWHEAKRAVRVTGALDPQNQAKSRTAKAKRASRVSSAQRLGSTLACSLVGAVHKPNGRTSPLGRVKPPFTRRGATGVPFRCNGEMSSRSSACDRGGGRGRRYCPQRLR